jgi:hypothetical protein
VIVEAWDALPSISRCASPWLGVTADPQGRVIPADVLPLDDAIPVASSLRGSTPLVAAEEACLHPLPPSPCCDGFVDAGPPAVERDDVKLLTAIPALDEVLDAHVSALGADLTAYRNHAYRVANACVALSSASGDQVRKIGIAAAFHDLGIWTDGTFDYLDPSIRLATSYLADRGMPAWTEEVTEMIAQHHKVTRYDGRPEWLVEAFRRADWVDVTRGALRFGLPGRFVREMYTTWPGAGFHRRLVQLSLARLRSHPLNPLPMFRL